MNKKVKCPKWHRFFYSFRGERYQRVTANVIGAEPRYIKWTVTHYCFACFRVVVENKLETNAVQD